MNECMNERKEERMGGNEIKIYHRIMLAASQVPNEHLLFSSDPIQKQRSEDAIIAFTWDHFLKDASDPTWLVRFPMVRMTR